MKIAPLTQLLKIQSICGLPIVTY